MLQILKDALKHGARPLARALSHAKSRGSVLFIPPTSLVGSVGDAAMYTVAFQHFRDQGWRVDVLGHEDLELDGHRPDKQIDGGGWLRWGPPRPPFRLLPALARYERVFLIGADVIDGAYNVPDVVKRIMVLGEAARLGAKATILGASFNDSPDADCVAALRDLPASVVICAREEPSRQRLEHHLGRPIRIVADLALLTAPFPEHPALVPFRAWRDRQSTVIAININNLQVAKEAGLPAATLAVARDLLGRGHSLLLVPHDVRGTPSDVSLLRELAAALGSDRVYLFDCQSPGAVKSALSHSDVVLTGRMHAAILALSSHVPVVSLTYQNKFEGLYALLGLGGQDLLLDPAAVSRNPELATAAVTGAFDRRAELTSIIAEHFPNVRKLAQANFRAEPAVIYGAIGSASNAPTRSATAGAMR